jgi:hypothetical protein
MQTAKLRSCAMPEAVALAGLVDPVFEHAGNPTNDPQRRLALKQNTFAQDGLLCPRCALSVFTPSKRVRFQQTEKLDMIAP